MEVIQLHQPAPTALESGTLVTQGSGGFASSPASVGGEKVRRLDKYLGSVQKSLEGEGPLSPQRTAIIDDAKLSNMQADSAYAKGDTETGDALVRIGYALGDAAIALSPIVVAALAPEAAVALAVTGAVAFGKSWYEARTGKRIWNGDALSVMDRQLAYLDVGISLLPGLAGAIPKVFDSLSGLLTAGKSAEEAKAIAGSVKAAEKIVNSAKKMGLNESSDIQRALGSRGKLPSFPDAGFKAPATFLDRHGKLTNGKYTISSEAMKPHTVGSFDATTHTGTSLPADKSQFFFATDADRVTLDAAAYADNAELWIGNKAKVKLNIPIGVHGGSGSITDTINVYRNNAGTVHASPASP